MAEVVILELVLDASKLQAGAKAASDALGGLGDKAGETEKRFRATGNALSSAFQASGGGIQIAQGITSTANAFGQLNTQAALFGASRTILELGKTAQDFRNLGNAAGAAGGAFSLLTAAWRASPLGLIATGVGLAAAAMSLLSMNTRQAAGEFTELAAAMEKANVAARVNEAFGLGGGEEAKLSGRLAAIRGALPLTYKDEAPSAEQLRDMVGGIENYIRMAGAAGNAKAQRQGEYTYDRWNRQVQIDYVAEGYLPPVSVAQSRAMLEMAGREGSSQLGMMRHRERNRGGLGPTYAKGSEPMGAVFAGQPQQDYVTISSEHQAEVDRANRMTQIEQAQKAMDELIAKGQEFGATIGDAFFNVASGAQSARQAIAGLISDMARAASREAFAGIFGHVAAGFGQTAVQTASNIQLPPRG